MRKPEYSGYLCCKGICYLFETAKKMSGFSRKELFVVLLSLCLLTLSCKYSIGQVNWQTISSSTSYDNRDEHGYVELFGKFYLLGGAYQSVTKVQEYDPVANSWTDKGNVPIDFHHFQPVAYDSLIWVLSSWRGQYGSEQNLANVYTYDPLTDTWTQGTTIPAVRRRGSAGVILSGGKFYILGGNSGGHGPQGDVKTWVDVYDPAGNGGLGSWDTLSPMPIGRDHFQAVAKDGKIFAVGGRDSGVPGNFFNTIRDQIDVYDIATDTWTTLPAAANLPTLRAGTSTLIMDDDIYVMLGVGTSSTQESDVVEAFNIITQTWRTLPPAPHTRSGTQAVPFGRNIFVASGRGSLFGGTDLYAQDKLYIPPPGSVSLTVTPPDDVVAVEGDSAVFTVFVYNSTTPVTFQWQRLVGQSWVPIPGASNSRYTLISTSTADDSSYFRVRVINATDTVFSDSALLTVGCDPVFIGNTDPIVMEAEHFQESYVRNGKSWNVINFTGGVGPILEAGPNTGANYNTNYTTQSPETQYDINFSQTGTYYVWVRTYSPTFEDNSYHTALDSIITGSSDKMTYDTYNQWGWTNQTMDGHAATFDVPSTGVHTLHLWMREDGVRVDRILLTKNSSYVPSGLGPAESSYCNPTVAFPIELGDWTARRDGQDVQLAWTTLREVNNAYFTIERSNDQQGWIGLGDVGGAGFSDELNTYGFRDIDPLSGLNYYRLKQVDFDGSFTYSNTLAVDVSFDSDLKVFPNPLSGNQLRIQFGHDGKQANVIIRDLRGQEVFRDEILSAEEGLIFRQLNLPELPKGVYLLEVENEERIQVAKLVIR